MNMERRLKKLSGLQPVYIDVNSNPTPQVSPIEEVVQEVNHNKVEVFIILAFFQQVSKEFCQE